MSDPAPEPPPPDAAAPSPRWRPWILPTAVSLLVIAALLHYTNADSFLGAYSWTLFAARSISCAVTVCIYSLPAALAAVLLFQTRRLRLLARLALLLAILEIPNQIYYYFFRSDSTWTDAYALLSALRSSINLACVGSGAAALMLLPTLRPRHARLRTFALYALLLLFLLDPGESLADRFLSTYISDACLILQLLAILTLLALLPIIIYHSLRHPLPFPHRPPPDAAPAVTLTCPRCSTAQTIPPNGGRCPNCQLRIYIALAEATCSHCGYPLRGLTSDRCPECGRLISTTPPDPNAPLLAWAAANDQQPSP
ncbi:MAG TPA: hypothetical protein VH253_08535 [Phycisphaerae bacterium]|nr:hypothetical protein [Phycisphaerae bacterium]